MDEASEVESRVRASLPLKVRYAKSINRSLGGEGSGEFGLFFLPYGFPRNHHNYMALGVDSSTVEKKFLRQRFGGGLAIVVREARALTFS